MSPGPSFMPLSLAGRPYQHMVSFFCSLLLYALFETFCLLGVLLVFLSFLLFFREVLFPLLLAVLVFSGCQLALLVLSVNVHCTCIVFQTLDWSSCFIYFFSEVLTAGLIFIQARICLYILMQSFHTCVFVSSFCSRHYIM